jgi:hypothetical protein
MWFFAVSEEFRGFFHYNDRYNEFITVVKNVNMTVVIRFF